MSDLQDKLLLFFTNEKLLKGIRSIGVSLVVLILPLLYFGYKNSFTFDALFDIDFGALVIIITISVVLATIETKTQCYDLTCEHDDDLPTLHKKVDENSKAIRKSDRKGKYTSKWLTKYNKEQQEIYDAKLTAERIEDLERKILSLRIKGNESKAVKLEKQVDKLKQSPLHDKDFIPYSLSKILNIDRSRFRFKRKKGNSDVDVNPKKINWTITLINMIIRSSGLGIMGTMPFILGEPVSTILLFYIGYVIVIAVTVISQWLITSYITTNAYKKGLEIIIHIQELLLKELPNYATEELAERQLQDIPFTEEQEVN